jgi:hypothetical protein
MVLLTVAGLVPGTVTWCLSIKTAKKPGSRPSLFPRSSVSSSGNESGKNHLRNANVPWMKPTWDICDLCALDRAGGKKQTEGRETSWATLSKALSKGFG